MGGRARWARTPHRLLWLLALLAGSGAAADTRAAQPAPDGAPPRVLTVTPAVQDGLLGCRLTTAGLPGDKLLSTLHSGLASAIDVDLLLLDDRGRAVAGNVVTLRLSYDLWEEAFTVATGAAIAQLPDDSALKDWLASPPWLPLGPLAAIAGTDPFSVRAALRLHALAPETRDDAAAMVAGPDGQSVSVGLGALIRSFYRRHDADAGLVGAAHSPPFRARELTDAPH
jgi:hypothetical protein